MSKKRRVVNSESSDASPPTKKMRYNNEMTASVVANINKIIEDDRTNDVTFIVGINGDTQHINGNKLLFAAQSEVLKNMLYGNMVESNSNEIIIDDITKDAFKYIKQIVHLSSPSLEYEHVVDILYAAKKYMISSIIKQCKEKILSIDDVNTFYLIMNSIGKYAPSTFESILADIVQSEFVEDYIDDITDDEEKFNSLKMFQVKLLIELIEDEFDKYEIIKLFCKSFVESEDDDILWQNCFSTHFVDYIDFTAFSLDELMDIRSDEVISESQLLNLIAVGVKELQTNNDKLKKKNASWKNGSKKLIKKIKELEQDVEDLEDEKKKLKKKISKLTKSKTYYNSFILRDDLFL